MQYILFMAVAPDFMVVAPDAPARSAASPSDRAEPERSPAAWIAELARRRADRGGARVRPAVEATAVRVRAGQTLVAGGPFARGAVQVAGFNLIEAADLDEAIEIAAQHPDARLGAVEIRPLWPG